MPYRQIKNNKLKRGKLNLILSKATQIAKNVIYTKNFSKKKRIGINLLDSVIIKYPSKTNVDFFVDKLKVKIVKGDDPLLKAAQKLRYQNFFNIKNLESKLDVDEFDNFCDHLLVIDTEISNDFVVGTYRLMMNAGGNNKIKLYTETEFDLQNLKNKKSRILEAGRSCVHPDYRDGRIIRLLWRGLASYIFQNKVDYVVGCASFNETKVDKLLNELSYLYYFHQAPKSICSEPIITKSIFFKKIAKNQIDIKSTFKLLPPLIKAYLRVGSWIGKGAILDKKFKTIDVCIILKAKNIPNKYMSLAIK